MDVSTKYATAFCIIFMASTVVHEVHGRVIPGVMMTSLISRHLAAACDLFQSELLDEGGQCDPDVMEEVIDEVDEIETGAIDGEDIETYLEEAEKGKYCYSPNGLSVIQLKDGCAAMDAVCNLGANLMKCKHMPPTEAPSNIKKVRKERSAKN
ncbi:uncharacterized protein [Diadema setosum]|uniref:uncharacterized protein n=1 Tax=Diadema antillarum TaxID=105358 RepID=UPI003A86A581